LGVVTSALRLQFYYTYWCYCCSITVYAPDNGAFTAATATGGYLVGKTDAQVTTILRYHLENGNRTASSATSFTASTATADVSVATLFT
jgi:uncharacterized surface protein with fasciclin (FAS1) repeats